jgi:hypothetical protein
LRERFGIDWKSLADLYPEWIFDWNTIDKVYYRNNSNIKNGFEYKGFYSTTILWYIWLDHQPPQDGWISITSHKELSVRSSKTLPRSDSKRRNINHIVEKYVISYTS